MTALLTLRHNQDWSGAGLVLGLLVIALVAAIIDRKHEGPR